MSHFIKYITAARQADELLVSEAWYESNSEMLWSRCNAKLCTTDNLITALRWLDDEVLDESSKKEINLLLSQQFTKTWSTAWHSNISTRTHTHRFNGHFQVNPSLLVPRDSQTPFFAMPRVFTAQAKTLHISSDTATSGLLQTSFQSSSLSLHRHTLLDQICIIFMFDISKPPQFPS